MRTPTPSRACRILIAVSSNGAGYDTVDVAACTEAGVAVLNQTGGNKEGVAEHVLGLMLALSKRIGETDRFMRTRPNIERVAFMGHDILDHTVGIIGIGNVGSRVAELCRDLVPDARVSLRSVPYAANRSPHAALKRSHSKPFSRNPTSSR